MLLHCFLVGQDCPEWPLTHQLVLWFAQHIVALCKGQQQNHTISPELSLWINQTRTINSSKKHHLLDVWLCCTVLSSTILSLVRYTFLPSYLTKTLLVNMNSMIKIVWFSYPQWIVTLIIIAIFAFFLLVQRKPQQLVCSSKLLHAMPCVHWELEVLPGAHKDTLANESPNNSYADFNEAAKSWWVWRL